jgi:hypothetical protein
MDIAPENSAKRHQRYSGNNKADCRIIDSKICNSVTSCRKKAKTEQKRQQIGKIIKRSGQIKSDSLIDSKSPCEHSLVSITGCPCYHK